MTSLTPVKVYTDAAGGSDYKPGNGVGGYCPPTAWFYMAWPRYQICGLCLPSITPMKYDEACSPFPK